MKKGQVTIFIIIAVAVISIILLFFLYKSGVVPNISFGKEINSDSFLQSCLEDKIKESVGILSLQGGSIENPLNKTFKFSEEEKTREISYLCYTQNDNELCINQNSMLINSVENEIKNYISDEVENCFSDLKKSLEKRNYDLSSDYKSFEVNLEERRINVELDAEMTITKNDETLTKKDFNVFVKSKIYNLLVIVKEIVNQEASSCDFNYALFMLNYPNYIIEKIRTTNSEIIYRITDKKSKDSFRFAIRGCVISL